MENFTQWTWNRWGESAIPHDVHRPLDNGGSESHRATDQASVRADLTQEQVYQRGLIDAALDGLASLNPGLVITDVNHAICQLTGYSRSELIGSSFPELFKDASFAAESILSALKTRGVSNYELTVKKKSGPDATVLFNAMAFRDADGIHY